MPNGTSARRPISADAVNFEGELWGKERMFRAVKKCLGRTASNMVRKLLGYRRRFVGLASQMDDTSIVAINVDTTKASSMLSEEN